MDRKYWERIAPKYETEIFDVLQNDKLGHIVAAINEMASPEKTIIDIGCAVGKWTGERLERRTEEIELIRVRGLGSADGKNRCGAPLPS